MGSWFIHERAPSPEIFQTLLPGGVCSLLAQRSLIILPFPPAMNSMKTPFQEP